MLINFGATVYVEVLASLGVDLVLTTGSSAEPRQLKAKIVAHFDFKQALTKQEIYDRLVGHQNTSRLHLGS